MQNKAKLQMQNIEENVLEIKNERFLQRTLQTTYLIHFRFSANRSKVFTLVLYNVTIYAIYTYKVCIYAKSTLFLVTIFCNIGIYIFISCRELAEFSLLQL